MSSGISKPHWESEFRPGSGADHISLFGHDKFFICGWGKEPHLPGSFILVGF